MRSMDAGFHATLYGSSRVDACLAWLVLQVLSCSTQINSHHIRSDHTVPHQLGCSAVYYDTLPVRSRVPRVDLWHVGSVDTYGTA